MNANSITPAELAEIYRTGAPIDLLDVRSPAEFQEIHCSFARNLPLSELDPKQFWQTRGERSGEALYVICRSGGRGQQACEKFRAAGFSNVFNVEGGTSAWAESGFPVIRGAKSISLERQVRIAAGSLVLLGVILGYVVSPSFIFLSAFVGAGLVFAGITDTCGMGLLLARAPWNRVGSCASASCPWTGNKPA